MNKCSSVAPFTLAWLLLVAATPLAAQTIISDRFSGSSGATINGRMPDTTDLPGGPYTSFGSSGSGTLTGNGQLQIGPDTGASLSISSSGAYVEPAAMTISAGMEVGNLPGSDLGTGAQFRGVGLGFYPTQTGNNAFTNFLGIVLNPAGPSSPAGAVSFSQSQGATESNLVTPVAWPTAALGAFSTSTAYVISYTINTAVANGGISNVSVTNPSTGVTDAADYTAIDDYSGANPFTASTTSYAALMGTGSTVGDMGYFSNFLLAAANVAAPTGSAWTGASSSVWGSVGNWTGGAPGATSGTTSTGSVVFNANDPSNPTPIVDSGRNVQNISFDNSAGNLTTSLTLGTTGGNALLLTNGGLIQTTFSVENAQNVNAPLVLEGANGTYTFSSNGGTTAATLNFGGRISGGAAGTTTLTLAGVNGGANTISGAIVDGSATHLALTQSSGAWTLSGANTYTGPTTVGGGILSLVAGGSLGNTAISINSGTFAPLAGSGTLLAGTTGAGSLGASLTLGGGATFSMVDGQVGTFNLQQQSVFSGPALRLDGGTLNFDMGSSGADKLAVGVGQALIAGTNSIGISPAGSSLGSGPYTLISAPAGGLSGTFQFTGGGTTKFVSAGSSYYQLSLNTTNTAVTVSATPINFILRDTFNVAASTNFTAHVPDINVPNPGGTYSIQGNLGVYGLGGVHPDAYVHVGGSASLGADLGAGLPIASHGNYTEPTSMTISASLQSSTIQGGSDVWRGTGLGFYSQMVSSSGQAGYFNFQGVVLDPTGNIDLVQCGAANPKVILAQVPWPSALGAFSTSSYYTITYTVNTAAANGGISNVSVSNGAVTDTADFAAIDAYSGANPFTVANVAYAGFTGSSGNFTGNGLIENFSLIAPSAAAPAGWTGASDGTWANTGNWRTGVVPGSTTSTSNTDTALFNQSAVNSPLVIDAGRNLQNITFDLTANVLKIGTTGGNALYLTSGGTIQTTAVVASPDAVNAPLVLEGNYTFTSNATSGSATVSFGGGITSGAASGTTTLTLNGANTGPNTLSGVLADGTAGSKLALSVSGAGLWVLNGATSTYSGGTTIASGATLELAGSVSALSQSMNIANSGSLVVASSANQKVGMILSTGSVTVSSGILTAYEIRQNSLTIGSGATVTLAPSGSGSTSNPTGPNNVDVSSSLTSLSIAGTTNAWTGTLDIGNNGLVIAYGSAPDPYTSIDNLIFSGYAGGTWDGAGITSSIAHAVVVLGSKAPALNIGLVDFTPGAGNYANTTFIVFEGQTITTNAVLVRLTYMDDLILAGDTLGSDATDDALLFAANYGSGTTWAVGDLTHDGVINTNDALLFAANYATGLPSLDGTTGSAAALGGNTAAVPEPSSLALAALSALGLGLLARRRRRG